MAAAKIGFSASDANYLIYLATLEKNFIHWTGVAMTRIVDTHTGSREVASELADVLRAVFDFTTLHDAIIHDACREIIMPFQARANGQSGDFPIAPAHILDTTPISRWEE